MALVILENCEQFRKKDDVKIKITRGEGWVKKDTLEYFSEIPEGEDSTNYGKLATRIRKDQTGEIYEITDLIPAGEHVEWMPSEDLYEGEHTLIFNETPFFAWEESETGYVQLTQANNEVVFTVL